MLHFRLRLDYNLLALLEPLLTAQDVQIREELFDEQVGLDLLVPACRLSQIEQQISQLSSGTIRLQVKRNHL